MRRPGVAITISTPFLRSRICGPLGAPPYRQVHLILEEAPNFRDSSRICTASSRVGAIVSTMGPSPGLRYGCALMCTIAGSMNASVLPEPVDARPIMSRPRSAIGHPCAWIGVGAGKPAFLISWST